MHGFKRVLALSLAVVSAAPSSSRAAGRAPIVELSTGGEQCARRSDGSLWCWGERRNHADGVIAKPSNEGVQVASGVKQFATGGFRGVAIRGDGVPVVWRWKLSPAGVAQDVTLEPHPQVTDAVDVALVASEIVVLVRADGSVITWSPRSQEGGPQYGSKSVDGLAKVRSVACGSVSCCALVTGGGVACFEPSDARAREAKDVKGASEVLVGDTQAIVKTGKGQVLLDLVPGRAPKQVKAKLGLYKFFKGGCGLDKKGVVACPWMLGEELDVMPGLGRGAVVASVGGGHACVVSSKGRVSCRRYADAARGRIDPVVEVKFREPPPAP